MKVDVTRTLPYILTTWWGILLCVLLGVYAAGFIVYICLGWEPKTAAIWPLWLLLAILGVGPQ